jgi:hypothetical protein
VSKFVTYLLKGQSKKRTVEVTATERSVAGSLRAAIKAKLAKIHNAEVSDITNVQFAD